MTAGTLCRCGHLLGCCADCMGWMRENSARIEAQWRVLCKWWGAGFQVANIGDANTAEGFYDHLFESMR